MRELDTVVLTADLEDGHLKKGDLGTIVFVHDEGRGYEVEFLTLSGATLAVLTVEAHLVRPVRDREIATVRYVA